MPEVWTVSELNERIKAVLESSFTFVWVEGEISNLRRPASGHSYFTLKDERSQIRAVLFRTATKQSFVLEDGMHIVCRARLTAYTPRGEYQLLVERVEPRGLGALQKAFEQLKARLQDEGLFDPRHKKPLPFLPRGIGVVTSPTGAVIRDILQITKRRFPSVPITIVPVRVQGPEAAPEIIRALAILNGEGGESCPTPDIDVVVIARGGGSLEDLYPFNTEGVARAVFKSRLPVVSAVGHETDFTITDFVADLRAPTPSAAAELVVPSREELRRQVASSWGRLRQARQRQADRRRERLATAAGRLKSPARILGDYRLLLDDQRDRLSLSLSRQLHSRRHSLEYLQTRFERVHPTVITARAREILTRRWEQLTAGMGNLLREGRAAVNKHHQGLRNLNPLAVLERGYSITRRLSDGMIVKDAATLSPGVRLVIRVAAGGDIRARVEETAGGDRQESGSLF